jgi:hypothetical protein
MITRSAPYCAAGRSLLAALKGRPSTSRRTAFVGALETARVDSAQ